MFSIIFKALPNYAQIFPETSKDQAKYFDILLKKLFDSKLSDFQEFTIFFTEIIKEKVTNTIQRIDTFLKNTASNLKAEVEQIPTAQLKELLIQSKFENKCGQILKQLENINKFRPN